MREINLETWDPTGKKVLLYSGGMDSWLIDKIWKPDIKLFIDINTNSSNAELEHLPVLLVEGDLGLDLLPLHGKKGFQIQLIAQAAEEGHVAPGGQRRGAKGLGMGCGGDMGAER